MLFATRIIFLTAGLLAVNAAQSASKNSTSTATGVVANTTSSAAPPNASGIFSGLSPCALECVEGAATINKCSVTDVSCLCSSAQLQADAEACLTIHCTDDDQDAVGSLQDEQCAAVGTPTAFVASTNSVPFTLPASGSSGGNTAAGTATGAPAGSTTPTSPASDSSSAVPSQTSPSAASDSSGAAPSQTSPSAANQLVALNSRFSLLIAAAGVLAGGLVL